MTPATLAAACAIPLVRAQVWADPIAEALNLGKCRTAEQIAVFLATCGHESAGFERLVESLNYTPEALMRVWPSRFDREIAKQLGRIDGRPAKQREIANIAYGGRMGNRRMHPDDGWRYRGRGIIQLTGLDNYRAMGRALGEPYEADPDMVAEPRHAALTAGQYWADNKLAEYGGKIMIVSRAVNMGSPNAAGIPHGMPDRERRYRVALSVLRGETPGEAVRRMLG